MAAPSELLVGANISGWQVVAHLATYPGMTGGHFSSGYEVSKDGKKAFLKAMDLLSAQARGIRIVNQTTQEFLFEQELCRMCGDKRLSHIVRLLDYGEKRWSEIAALPASATDTVVYYLIFEWSEGDIRREITLGGHKQPSWCLHVLHQTAVALTQLHGVNVHHQDVKPSNVLGFKAKDIYKLGDLGRSTALDRPSPSSMLTFPGDFSYAPLEYLYGHKPADMHDRRTGSDAYLLGSLISFLFTHVGATINTLTHMQDEYKPGIWKGAFVDVLPFLESAHTSCTQELRKSLPPTVAQELGDIYFNLCHPNPEYRGHPDARKQTGRPVGLERYLSRFSHLKYQLKVEERAQA